LDSIGGGDARGGAISSRRFGRIVGGCAFILAACVALGGPLVAPAGATTRPCVLPVEPTTDRENLVWPEVTTTYESGFVPIPPGGHTEIKGLYPHARFFSLQTSGVNGRNIGAWADYEIQPDPGSSNPFLPGADRTTPRRSYTLTMVDRPVPDDGPEPNTLYSSSTDGLVRNPPGTALLTLRYYLPDRGTGRTAGVPAPEITMVTAAGQRLPTPECKDELGDPGYTQAIAATGPQSSVMPGTGPLAARSVPVWHKFVNAAGGLAAATTDNDTTGTTVYPQTPDHTDRAPAGFFENIFNKYVFTTMSSDFGQVLVFRGKLPTTPRTFEGQPTMGTGQLRFWSVCTGSAQTTVTYGCIVDKDVPVSKRGRRFTLVVSTAAARPANAISRCGVTWLPMGPPGQTVAILRNMLPAMRFARAIQNVEPGKEQGMMRRYYPVGRYYPTTESFEQRGCPA
jgi:hypothetical protein